MQSVSDGIVYVGIRFTDKTVFSLRYACDILIVGADYLDAKTGDGSVDILEERADASGGRGYRQDRAAELGESGWPGCARERARRACA